MRRCRELDIPRASEDRKRSRPPAVKPCRHAAQDRSARRWAGPRRPERVRTSCLARSRTRPLPARSAPGRFRCCGRRTRGRRTPRVRPPARERLGSVARQESAAVSRRPSRRSMRGRAMSTPLPPGIRRREKAACMPGRPIRLEGGGGQPLRPVVLSRRRRLEQSNPRPRQEAAPELQSWVRPLRGPSSGSWLTSFGQGTAHAPTTSVGPAGDPTPPEIGRRPQRLETPEVVTRGALCALSGS